MYNFLTRNGSTIAFILGLLIAVGMLLSIFGGLDEFSAYPETDLARYDTTIFNFGMQAAIALVIIAAAAAILFGIYHLVTNPKGALKGLLGVGLIVALFFIAYSTADPDMAMLESLRDFGVTADQSKFISGALWTAIILAGIAFAAAIISEIINFFK